ncbi:hypothetical protein Tco_1272791 [Tanacetum coccineum]
MTSPSSHPSTLQAPSSPPLATKLHDHLLKVPKTRIEAKNQEKESIEVITRKRTHPRGAGYAQVDMLCGSDGVQCKSSTWDGDRRTYDFLMDVGWWMGQEDSSHEKERKGDTEMTDADQNVSQEKSYEQVVKDAHVTLTSSQKTGGSKQSSSVSSALQVNFSTWITYHHSSMKSLL